MKIIRHLLRVILCEYFSCIDFYFSFQGAKTAADGTVIYALKYNSKIKLMSTNDLVIKFPEKLVAYLESQIQFEWPPRDVNAIDGTINNCAVQITACTNQGDGGIRYLFSSDGQFVRVRRSKDSDAVAVVKFLESHLNFNECNPLPREIHRKLLRIQ